MSITYDEILHEMETQFYNECGEYVKDYPEVELRFKAVASEIYAAHTAADFALKQAFVQTATGEYLDKHAEMRGITRKGASRATGYLSFFVTQEYEENVDIPEGTICSVKDNPLIQFATNYRAFILPGDTGVTIEASALNEGEEYNVPADSITVMVNPPEYIYSVTNQRAFTGGSDPESDESLRQRIIDSYGSALSNGVNVKSMIEQILTIDDIKDCSIEYDPEENITHVWLRTASDEPLDSYITDKVEEKLGILEICNVDYDITLAQKNAFSVFAAVQAARGADKEKLLSNVETAIREACSGQKIGTQINLSSVTASVISVDNVELAEISAQPSYEGVIPCPTGGYLSLDDVQVEIYE